MSLMRKARAEMLDIEDLMELEDSLKKELDDRLGEILSRLNRTEQIEELLELLGLSELLARESGYEVYRTGKIVVIGQSDVKGEVLQAVGKSLGISKDRFEFYLDYEDAKKFNFRKMKWTPSYSLVMVGPMPHSGAAKGIFGSIISALESEEGYPPIVRLGSNSLKITKSDFKNKLQEAIEKKVA